MTELINADLIALDASFGDSKDDVISALARLIADVGRSADAAGLADDAFAREAKSVTGMPGGLAIPHCRSEHVSAPTLVFARLSPPIDFGAKDGPADHVFMIAAPAGIFVLFAVDGVLGFIAALAIATAVAAAAVVALKSAGHHSADVTDDAPVAVTA